MSFLLSLTEDQTFQALGQVLQQILPAGTPIVRGQVNRVPEVKGPNFVVMTPILRERLATNVDEFDDLAFVASIAATIMTVTAVSIGAITPGTLIAGPHVAANTTVISQTSGPSGGIGTYTVSPSQTAASGLVWGGTNAMMQGTKITVQLDVHGPASADNAQIISTVFRDATGVDLFAVTGFDVSPLFTQEPRQMPFGNEQQQVEERWAVDAILQANPVLTTQQQFADVLTIELVDVDVVYPPT